MIHISNENVNHHFNTFIKSGTKLFHLKIKKIVIKKYFLILFFLFMNLEIPNALAKNNSSVDDGFFYIKILNISKSGCKDLYEFKVLKRNIYDNYDTYFHFSIDKKQDPLHVGDYKLQVFSEKYPSPVNSLTIYKVGMSLMKKSGSSFETIGQIFQFSNTNKFLSVFRTSEKNQALEMRIFEKSFTDTLNFP
jgi:hypothetical protein